MQRDARDSRVGGKREKKKDGKRKKRGGIKRALEPA